jgi:formylglycine-generating enzyme required for sulfatase activity
VKNDHPRRGRLHADVSTAAPVQTKDMRWIPAGEFLMGSEEFYEEEQPAHVVELDAFWIDEHPVTVAEFRRFVEETGHVTCAERVPDPVDYPDADPELLVPGSLVFRPSAGPVDLRDFRNWWEWRPGALWRRPEGPESNVGGRELHPVTHVTPADAEAYASWAGKELPTEAQWEYAARGGLEGAVFTWGDEFAPRGKLMANTWQGEFPWQNLLEDGFERTSPVKRFPANGYGLHDMAGNVWEWTADYFTPTHGRDDAAERSCCAPRNPRVMNPKQSHEAGAPGEQIPRRVIKGGSHLCAPNYCLRYRPAARQAEAVDTSTSHIGFRCVITPTG